MKQNSQTKYIGIEVDCRNLQNFMEENTMFFRQKNTTFGWESSIPVAVSAIFTDRVFLFVSKGLTSNAYKANGCQT